MGVDIRLHERRERTIEEFLLAGARPVQANREKP